MSTESEEQVMQASDTVTESDYLALSDEEFEKLGPGIFSDPVEDTAAEKEEEATEEDDKEALADEDETSVDDASETEEVSDDASEKDNDTTGDDDGDDDASADDTDESDTEDQPDYKAQIAELISPFKANGKEMSVKDVAEARKLMQMGANYNKKMAGMKPGLKMLKMLERNELLDETKLNFLIDLNAKKPEAITQLLKDSKIDLHTLNVDEEDRPDYKATDHSIADSDLELDTVVEELRSSEHYTQTLDVVTNVWDAESRQIVAQNPQLLKIINGHIANGQYDQISNAVEKERMFGRLTDVSDIEAYKQTGDALFASSELVGSQKRTEPKAEVTPKQVSKPSDEERREKRRAASPTKPAAKAAESSKEYNPLGMSDEAFISAYDETLV
jgi:hypothetical protein